MVDVREGGGNTYRNDREDTGIDNPEALDTVDPQFRIHDTLLDALAQPRGAARVEARLRALEDLADHGLVAVARHGPGVVALDDVLQPVARHDDVVDHAHALAQRDQV